MGDVLSMMNNASSDPTKQSNITNESNLLHIYEKYETLMNEQIIQNQYNPSKLQNNPKMEYYFGFLNEHFYENLKNRAKERMMYQLIIIYLCLEMG